MISLKASRFLVSYEDGESKVFTRISRSEYKEITNELSVEEKDELLDDLIYAICDLIEENKKSKATLQMW